MKTWATRRTALVERRCGEDRRQVDGMPPGRHERRRRPEARKPEVLELQMSQAEWAALREATTVPLRRPEGGAKP